MCRLSSTLLPFISVSCSSPISRASLSCFGLGVLDLRSQVRAGGGQNRGLEKGLSLAATNLLHAGKSQWQRAQREDHTADEQTPQTVESAFPIVDIQFVCFDLIRSIRRTCLPTKRRDQRRKRIPPRKGNKLQQLLTGEAPNCLLNVTPMKNCLARVMNPI